MKNNSHAESKEDRLKRFQDGPPLEVIGTLLNSIANFFNNEISITIQGKNYQTSLLFMGIHAVALTISEGLFGRGGPDGYKLFLARFVDGNTPDTRFSTIADVIHGWRNILAHQWIGSMGHTFGYDYSMALGWERRGGAVYINPQIYCDHYLRAFGSSGRIWDYESMLTDVELQEAKDRLVKKYLDK